MDSFTSTVSLKNCKFCGYQSTRTFNVYRHEIRIHRRIQHGRGITCCNEKFRTKGEFYAHVEMNHPETRRGLVSRQKYKIVESLLETYNLTTKSRKKRRVKVAPKIQRHRSLRIAKMNCSPNYSVDHDKQLEKEKFLNDSLPLKKRILKEFTGNQLLEPAAPKKNFEKSKENLSTEVLPKVNLDPNIVWPKKQHITEYLSDIIFEIFKI